MNRHFFMFLFTRKTEECSILGRHHQRLFVLLPLEMKKTKTNLVILASGNGSNAQNIAEYFSDRNDVNVSTVATNKADSGVINRAENLDIPVLIFTKSDLLDPNRLTAILKKMNPDLIVLAGFLLQIPEHFIEAFPNRIVNIHPALLPKFGGKGMYGMNVHKAVKEAGEEKTGITIHYVNENYDEGEIVFQATTDLLPGDDATDIAKKIHALEQEHFPKVIDSILKS